MITSFRTVIHGRTIELPWDLGLPEGYVVEVTIKTRPDVESPQEPAPPQWLERFDMDSTVKVGKFVVQGTRLLVDDLVKLLEEGRTDEELRQLHPELTPADVEAVRQYARVPAGLRRSFGGWAEDAEELDKYLEWNRQQRKLRRREIEE